MWGGGQGPGGARGPHGLWGSGRAGCGLDVSTSLASEGPGAARRLVPVAPRLSQMALPASAPRDWAQPLGGALPQLPPCPAGCPGGAAWPPSVLGGGASERLVPCEHALVSAC